jgi:hypothetical protein
MAGLQCFLHGTVSANTSSSTADTNEDRLVGAARLSLNGLKAGSTTSLTLQLSQTVHPTQVVEQVAKPNISCSPVGDCLMMPFIVPASACVDTQLQSITKHALILCNSFF